VEIIVLTASMPSSAKLSASKKLRFVLVLLVAFHSKLRAIITVIPITTTATITSMKLSPALNLNSFMANN